MLPKENYRKKWGIIADEWTFMGKFNPLTTAVKSSSTIYLARKLKFVKAIPDGTEQIRTLKIKFEDALKMVLDGEITQGSSCVLILKISEYLKNKNLA